MLDEREVIVPVNPALVKLVDVVEAAEITDMNYIFRYHRLKLPTNNYSNYFALFYKERQQDTWSVSRSLLSKDFTAAKTEVVINQIQENLGGVVHDQRHFREQTSVKCSFTLTGYNIDINDDNDMDKVLFALITNINTDAALLKSAALTFNVINGFGGNLALNLSFGVMKTLRVDGIGNEDKSASMNNIFLLDSFTKRLIHDSRMDINISDVTNVQNQLARQIETFKRFTVSQTMFEELMDLMPKKISKKFECMFYALPENFRNWYYCSYVLSAVVEAEKRIVLEVKLRSHVTKKIRSLLRAETQL